jgi:branched-chain amino acid transport system substrate-binding protein
MQSNITRRALLAGAAGTIPLLAAPGLLRAQSTSRPVQLGLISDMGGPFRDVGGPGQRVAAELAVQDFGGSVLGRPIVVRQADGQNRADISAQLAREWLDREGVDALADGAASSAGLAIQEVCRERKRVYLITGPATSDMTGTRCSPYGMQFGYDTYALSHGTATALTKAGGDTWFFITADYAFGHALERDATNAVRANGGRVLGAVKAPLNTSDFSSFLIQARASGAKVVGLANAGTDLQNCVKQASEFGLTRGGRIRMATLLVQIPDVVSLGHQTCEGMVFTDSFYWDMSDKARAFAARFQQRIPQHPPGLQHAGVYGATLHWLKAVQASGTTEADAVVAAMKAMPMNDMYNEDVRIREDGRAMHRMYLWQVKPAAEAKSRFDFCNLVAAIPPEEAWRPLKDGGCPLVRS